MMKDENKNSGGGKHKKEKLTDNKELMEVMRAAGEDNFPEAAEKIAVMEQKQNEDGGEAGGNEADDYKTPAQKLMEEYAQTQEGVNIKYDLLPEELGRALLIFQKKTLYNKNIIYTVLLGVIAVLFGINMFLYPKNLINFIVALGCAFIIFLLWSLPHKHIKAVKAASTAVSETFSATVYKDCMFAGEAPGKVTHITYSKKSFAAEDEDGFVLGVDRERLFMFPYRCMDEAGVSKLREIFKKAFGENFQGNDNNEDEVRTDG